MTIKFSQFLNGVVPRTTDIVVGLRGFPAAPLNERFNFTGVADTDGNNIASWSSVGALAVNYLDFKNSLTTLGPTIAAVGTDAAINLNIGGKGNSSYTQFLGTRAIAVPAGTTAEELTGIVGGLRYDTDTDYLRYWDIGANAWVDIIAGAAYDDATYVTNTDETANLPNSQPLSALASGLMFVTTTTGIVSSVALPLGATNGGTGQSTYALGDTLYSSAANTLSKLAGNITTAKQFLSQTGTGAVSAAPVWATISGGDITGAALTRTDDTNVTLTLGGSPSTALLNATSITAGWAGQLSLTRGGTNASLVASNGGIVYSTATAMAILSGTATANQMLQSGASGAPSWSTATWPSTAGSAGTILRSNGTNWVNSTATFADTYTASNLLYSNGANTVTGLSTANSAALVTSSTGVPAWSSTMTDGQVIIGSTGATPVAASLTAGSGVTITPGAGTITIAATGSGGTVTSVSGTANRITSTGGATPVIDISASYVGQSSITTVGALASGSLAAGFTPVTVPLGGTGNTTFTAYSVICAGTTATGTFQNVSGVGTSGQVLTSNGAAALPTWQSSSASTGRLIATQVFKADGTYTPTAGATQALVRAWGGGGGGGSSNNGIGGGGGGGGAYVEALFAISGLTPATITIGAGGAGALANNATSGANGGTTSFGSTLIASGGTSPANGNNAGGAGGTIAACTVPSGGFAIAGGKGGDSNSVSLIANGGGSFGSFSPVFYGNSAANGVSNTGQGGGAGLNVANAGNGASGLMVIYEYS